MNRERPMRPAFSERDENTQVLGRACWPVPAFRGENSRRGALGCVVFNALSRDKAICPLIWPSLQLSYDS